MRWHQKNQTHTWIVATLAVGCLMVANGLADDAGTRKETVDKKNASQFVPPNLSHLGKLAPAPPDVSRLLTTQKPAPVTRQFDRSIARRPTFVQRIPAPSHVTAADQTRFVRFKTVQDGDANAGSEGDEKKDPNVLALGLDYSAVTANFSRVLTSEDDKANNRVPESSAEQVLVGLFQNRQRTDWEQSNRLSITTEGVASPWASETFTWTTPGFYHNPLYFEETNLERYGQHRWAQPVVSGAHFFGALAILPYNVGAYPRCEALYTLGHHRPGSCNPHQFQWLPFSWRGLVYQGGATIGAAYILP